MRQPVDDDRTIRLTKPAAPGIRTSRTVPVWALATPALLAFAALGVWLSWPASHRSPDPSVVAQQAVIVPPQVNPLPAAPAPTPAGLAPPSDVRTNPESGSAPALPAAPPSPPAIASPEPARTLAAPAEFAVQTASEQQILDHISVAGTPDPAVFRFRPNPAILVLDFASLLNQGRMLNRVAALAEKYGLPHDRLLSDAELDQAVRAAGDTVETFYYGHDYGAAELIRFFALAGRDNIPLLADEDRLARLMRQGGWFEPNARTALISIPQIGADEHVTRSTRASILHHELSHGEYFTNPDYAIFVHRFWTRTLSSDERERIRNHLRSEGYDAGLEDVMENEAQAYLMFTDSAEFFTPEMIGMSTSRLTELRNGFFRTMPAGWLRDSLGRTLKPNKASTTPQP